MNKNFIIYLIIGILVMAVNRMIICHLIKTQKQAIVFLIAKLVIIIAAAFYIFVFKPSHYTASMISSFILAMLVPYRPKDKPAGQ